MATSFPNSLDSLTNPESTDSLTGHAQQHSNLNDAVEALQTKVGANNSLVTTSLDYRISQLESGGQVGTELGLAGNNDATITGIENKTTIDSFSKSLYSTVRYVLQFTKNSEIVSDGFDIVNDQTDLSVTHYEISSNTANKLVDITLEDISGIINLCITPVSGSVSVRYYRTALKA